MLSVIIPCYNEADNIIPIYDKLCKILYGYRYELLFIDDGSLDTTLKQLASLAEKDTHVKYISFSRNFGHQNALKAGYDFAQGDCILSMDADMQHPPELIPRMIEKWQAGYEVVYTLRDDSKNTTFLSRITSRIFYGILNLFSETEIVPGSADFRILDRKVADEVKKLQENDLFLRGLISWVGFRQTAITYIPNKRLSGKTKYSFSKRLRFAASGITAFSTQPLKISILIGFIFAFSAFIYGLYAIYEAAFTNNTITGWTSLIVSILFIGGIQLIMIGILGEYLGKLFLENKKRPNYIIRETNIGDE